MFLNAKPHHFKNITTTRMVRAEEPLSIREDLGVKPRA